MNITSNGSIFTAEVVTPRHPDKFCDFLSDTLVDAYRALDPNARCAIEVMGGHGVITVKGEVTIKGEAEVEVAKIISAIVGPEYQIKVRLVKQSPEIAQGVDTGGAGDQGIMIGYACADTANFMPLEYELARGLARHIYKQYPYDGKTQITVQRSGQDKWRIKTVVASFQHAKSTDLEKLAKEFLAKFVDAKTEYFCNPSGDWEQGGFDADTGLTGRKIVVDAYGPRVPVGGGAFSGKDHTKVDRSGAYMARRVAVDLLQARQAKEVLVKLAYAIGRRDPVKAVALVDGVEEELTGYDLSPAGIRSQLKLDTVKFAPLAEWGHFGNERPWD